MRRALIILAWTFGVLVLLIVAAGGFVYVFATSDYVRAQVENHASVIAGRATAIHVVGAAEIGRRDGDQPAAASPSYWPNKPTGEDLAGIHLRQMKPL